MIVRPTARPIRSIPSTGWVPFALSALLVVPRVVIPRGTGPLLVKLDLAMAFSALWARIETA